VIVHGRTGTCLAFPKRIIVGGGGSGGGCGGGGSGIHGRGPLSDERGTLFRLASCYNASVIYYSAIICHFNYQKNNNNNNQHSTEFYMDTFFYNYCTQKIIYLNIIAVKINSININNNINKLNKL